MTHFIGDRSGDPNQRDYKLVIDIDLAFILRQVSNPVSMVEYSPLLR